MQETLDAAMDAEIDELQQLNEVRTDNNDVYEEFSNQIANATHANEAEEIVEEEGDLDRDIPEDVTGGYVQNEHPWQGRCVPKILSQTFFGSNGVIRFLILFSLSLNLFYRSSLHKLCENFAG